MEPCPKGTIVLAKIKQQCLGALRDSLVGVSAAKAEARDIGVAAANKLAKAGQLLRVACFLLFVSLDVLESCLSIRHNQLKLQHKISTKMGNV